MAQAIAFKPARVDLSFLFLPVRPLVIVLLACLSLPVWGQEVLENNPPSVKFYKINTPHFKVLYPKGFEAQAQRVANTLEHIHEPEAQSMGGTPRKVSVILQNQSSLSNGFATLIPRRTEFYTMPPQDYNFLGTNDWLDQLASHEYRHIVQYQRVNSGFNRVLYYAFGPATLAAMASISVPRWVWEGDAVATETAFTHSGRGRIPNFGLVLRTNLQEGRVFTYNKQYLRSYKHNINDHYVLGYHMISYLRKHTGDDEVWNKVMKRTAGVPFWPFMFSRSTKKVAGLTLPQLYRATAADLQQTWAEQLKGVELTPFQTLHARKSKAYTDYQYPQPLSNGRIVTAKSGIGDFTQYIILHDGKEHKGFIPGVVNDAGMLSTAGSKVVWAEYGYDPRWRVKNYSQIKSYDFDTREYKVLTRKSRYAGAALSPDGTKIVTVESETSYTVSLVVLRAENGAVLKKFDNPEQAFYSMARWSNDGSNIVALKTRDALRSVVAIDYASGTETVLIKPSYQNIGHPVLHGQYLLYSAPANGMDNIYALDLATQKTWQVTAAKYGAYSPAVSADGANILYSNQGRDGMDIVSVPFAPAAWKPVVQHDEPKEYYEHLAGQEGRPHLFDTIPAQAYATNRYHKITGIFNPYSWGVYVNPSQVQADIGIATQDVLSTTTIKAGYLYDVNERTGAWRLGVSYQGWYPIIDVDVRRANRSVDEGNIYYTRITGTDTTHNVMEKLVLEWKETTVEAGLRIPLITTNSRYHGNVSFANYVGYTHVTDFTNSIDGGGRLFPANYPQYFLRNYQDNGTLLYNHFSFSAYRLLKQSRRDIYSKWGQTVYLHAYSTPFGGDFSGKQFSIYTQLFFPGLFKHHSLWGYWGYQATDMPQVYINSEVGRDNYTFRNQIPLPRGVSVSRFEKFYSMSANYTLPLWYPDISIGPVLQIQRFRGNLFYDYGFGATTRTNGIISQTYASVGGELRMDFNVMRYLPQVNVGFRYSYGMQPVAVTRFEFILGLVNF